MGIYSTNRSSLGMYSSDEVVANENYVGAVGAMQMVIEATQNDHAIFESVLTADFMEAMAIREGAEVEIVTEASIGGFFEKIKELVKKAWEKIKGLFATFMAKINNVVIRDNKKFVDKYKKEVLTKNLSKMKYKWSEPKSAGMGTLLTAVDTYSSGVCSDMFSATTEEDVKKITDRVDDGDYLEDLLGAAVGQSSTTLAEFSKEAHDACFDDIDEEEGLDSARLTDIMQILTNSSKVLNELKKANTAVDKAFNKVLKEIDKNRNAIIKTIPGKDETAAQKDAKNLNLTRANGATKVVNAFATASSKISSSIITEIKFHITQCRRVFAQAAAFNAKAVKENAILVEAAGDQAEWEVESSFNDFE